MSNKYINKSRDLDEAKPIFLDERNVIMINMKCLNVFPVKMLYLPVLLTMAALSQAHPVTNTQQEGHNKPTIDGQARQVLLPAPQFPAELLLQPQFQYHHGFNLGGDKQFPR